MTVLNPTYTILGNYPFTRIAHLPAITTANTSYANPAYVVDDESIAVFGINSVTGNGNSLVVYVISTGPEVISNYGGVFTFYQTPYWNNNYIYIDKIIPLGNGLFLVVMSGQGPTISIAVRVQNLKLNNWSPIVIPLAGLSISNPCYNTITKLWYDGSQQILCAGFYDPTGQYGGPIFSSSYKVNKDASLTLIAQGNSGLYSSTPHRDDLDHTTGYGTGIYSYPTSNGMIQAWWYTFAQQFTQNITINPGSFTDCNTPNGAGVYSTNSQVWTNIYAQSNDPYFVDSNIPNISGSCLADGQCAVNLNGNFYEMNLTNSVVNPKFLLITNKYLFAVAPMSWGLEAFQAAIPPQFAFPNYLYRSGFNMVNQARPISITGNYKS